MGSFNDGNLERCLRDIRTYGAGTLPDFLKKGVRYGLLDELGQMQLEPQVAEYGPHKVQQRFRATRDFPAESLFLRVRDELQDWLTIELAFSDLPAFEHPLEFNDTVAQTY